jgi:hypothetical protein
MAQPGFGQSTAPFELVLSDSGTNSEVNSEGKRAAGRAAGTTVQVAVAQSTAQLTIAQSTVDGAWWAMCSGCMLKTARATEDPAATIKKIIFIENPPTEDGGH